MILTGSGGGNGVGTPRDNSVAFIGWDFPQGKQPETARLTVGRPFALVLGDVAPCSQSFAPCRHRTQRPLRPRGAGSVGAGISESLLRKPSSMAANRPAFGPIDVDHIDAIGGMHTVGISRMLQQHVSLGRYVQYRATMRQWHAQPRSRALDVRRRRQDASRRLPRTVVSTSPWGQGAGRARVPHPVRRRRALAAPVLPQPVVRQPARRGHGPMCYRFRQYPGGKTCCERSTLAACASSSSETETAAWRWLV